MCCDPAESVGSRQHWMWNMLKFSLISIDRITYFLLEHQKMFSFWHSNLNYIYVMYIDNKLVANSLWILFDDLQNIVHQQQKWILQKILTIFCSTPTCIIIIFTPHIWRWFEIKIYSITFKYSSCKKEKTNYLF